MHEDRKSSGPANAAATAWDIKSRSARPTINRPAGALPFEAVHATERQKLAERYVGAGTRKRSLFKVVEGAPAEVTEHELLGLALSGGGIRSATFSLGVLQALAAEGKLTSFDYLSTVSGGGYIGSWLSTWIARTSIDEVQTGLSGSPSIAASGAANAARVEPPEVAWLRRYSNYLAPRIGLFSADALTLIATWGRNVFLNLIVLVAFLVTLLLLPRLALTDIEWGFAHTTIVGTCAALLGAVFLLFIAFNLWKQAQPTHGYSWWVSKAGVFTTVMLPGMVATLAGVTWLFGVYRFDHDATLIALSVAVAAIVLILGAGWFWMQVKAHAILWFALGNTMIYTLAMAAALGVGVLLLGLTREWWASEAGLERAVATITFGPPVFLVGFGICGSVYVGLVGRTYYERAREWWSRMNAGFITLGCVWLVLFALAFYVPAATSWFYDKVSGWLTFAMVAGWVGSLLAALLTPKPHTLSKRAEDNVDKTLNIAASVFVIGFLIAIACSTTWFTTRLSGHVPSRPMPTQTISELGMTVRGEQGNIGAQVDWRRQETPSLHDYVATSIDDLKLVRSTEVVGVAYFPLATAVTFVLLLVFGWRVDVNKFSLHNMYKNRLIRCYLGASNADRMEQPFTGFDENDDLPLTRLAETPLNGGQVGPYHIINTALNISQGKNLAWQERKAASFVLSPRYCGFALAQTQGDTTRRAGVSWRRESGYRPTAEYAAGDREEPGFTVGMAMATSGAAISPNMGRATRPALAFVLTIFNARVGRWSPNPARSKWQKSSPRFGLICLLQELFGYSNEERSFVYLSDGGHFDNLGLYELVRNQCAVVVAVDAGADPGRRFGDLGEAVRKCRVDFGAEIELPLEALRGHRETGLAEEGFAVGTIRYDPANPRGKVGHLIFIKPTLRQRKDEPPDVLAYSSRNPTFPQQTTADQFFDESQFESYRKLGLFIARRCLAVHGALLPTRQLAPANPPGQAVNGLLAAGAADAKASARVPAAAAEKGAEAQTLEKAAQEDTPQQDEGKAAELMLEIPRSPQLLIIEERSCKDIVVGVPHHAPAGTPELPCPDHPDADENAGFLGRYLAERLKCCSVIACNYGVDVNKHRNTDYTGQIIRWSPKVLVEIHGHGGKKAGNDTIEISSGSSDNDRFSQALAERLQAACASSQGKLKRLTICGEYAKLRFKASDSVTISDKNNGWIPYHIELPPQLRKPADSPTGRPPPAGYQFCDVLADTLKVIHGL